MRSGRNHRPRADPEQPDPYIWELYGITQCDTMLVEWEGSGAPFDVWVYTVDANRVSMDDPFHYWETLARDSNSTSFAWLVDLPAGEYVSIRIFDSLGRNYTTDPKVIMSGTSDTCLPDEFRTQTSTSTSTYDAGGVLGGGYGYAASATTASTSASETNITYTYKYDNSGRVVTGVVLGCIGLAIVIAILLIVFCICYCRKKKRKAREAAAAPMPIFAQFVPTPGAAPVLYVQMVPGAPFVPAGASPEALAAVNAAAAGVTAAGTTATAIATEATAGTAGTDAHASVAAATAPAATARDAPLSPTPSRPDLSTEQEQQQPVASGSGTSGTQYEDAYDAHSGRSAVAGPSGSSPAAVGYSVRANASSSTVGSGVGVAK